MKSRIYDKRKRQRGNAMIYILLAIALLGLLTAAITSQQNSASDSLSDDQAELLATKAVAYAGSVKTSLDQMVMSGTPIDRMDFTMPGTGTYDTAPYHNKVMHPQGGGLTLEGADSNLFDADLTSPDPKYGWYLGRFNNTSWTPSGANDVMLVAYGINLQVCGLINKRIKGSSNIPNLSITSPALRDYFIDTAYHGGGANQPFDATICTTCESRYSLCVSASDGGSGRVGVYYNIIAAQ